MALELPKLELKRKNDKKPGQKNDLVLKFVEFFDKNPFMKILVPVVLLLIIIGIVAFFIFGDGVLFDKEQPDDNKTPSNEVSVLPGNNIIHDKDVVELINKDPLAEDILASATYQGCVKGSSGMKTALIKIGSQGDSLVLTLGETVGESSWELIELTDDYVIFKAGDITKKITAK